ncbi:MAG: PTS transporter subunit EIIC [Lachnospiraceae bacterium]|nr:PTS transporter subunit EIIC [Lachnospiraceae bacterium]
MYKIKKGLSSVFDHISECMAPIIPIVLAGGIFKMVVLLLTTLHVLSGTTETILSAIATTPFYFLPVMVAYSAAKHFKAEPLLAIVSVCVMLLPDFAALMESGEKVMFIGIPVVPATYAYSVIPIILLIYCMSHVERLLRKLIKESMQPYLLAACVILPTSLLGILIIEPIVSLISNMLANSLNAMQTQVPVVAWGLLAAITSFLVSTGMHWIFITLAITQIGLTGVDYGIMVAFLISNTSLAGCDLGVFVKSKTSDKKAMAVGAMAAVLLPGISEPSIFGVCFKEKTPLLGNVLGCMIAGMVQGILTVHCYIFTFPSIPSILMFYSASEANNLLKALIVAAVSFMVSFLITMLVYRDGQPKTKERTAKA